MVMEEIFGERLLGLKHGHDCAVFLTICRNMNHCTAKLFPKKNEETFRAYHDKNIYQRFRIG